METGTDIAPRRPSPVVLAATLLGLLAALLAAGSVGLLAHSLRRALLWILLAGLAILARPSPKGRARFGRIVLLATAALAVALTASSLQELNVMAVPVVLAVLAARHRHADRRALASAATAAGVFALYRFVLLSVPDFWSVADGVGHAFGWLVGLATAHPMKLGPSFAGADFLVLVFAWIAAWLIHTRGRLAVRAAYAASAAMLAHVLHLLGLAFVPDIVALLPAFDPAKPDPFWISLVRHALPWNWMSVTAALHLGVIGIMARWADWKPDDAPADGTDAACCPILQRLRSPWATIGGAILLAAALGFSATYASPIPPLEGRKIVIYEKGFLNWLKPEYGEYGRLSIGMYGLLPHFLESLGAKCLVSPALSAQDIEGADAVVLIFPDDPWEPGQLDRVWDYVRGGGSLWILGEHTVRDKDGGSRFNEALAPSRIRVLFDSATYAVGGWLQSYENITHPATALLPDDRNPCGLVIGASLDIAWPARPLILGRWGWSDWGDEGRNAMMGNGHYDSGERLGDLVLAAEQRVGKGRVVAFGDTSNLSNGINMGSYPFNARMFASLAGRTADPFAAWRGATTLALAALLVLAFVARPAATGVVALFVVLALVRFGLVTRSARGDAALIPHHEKTAAYDIAYVDASHVGLYSAEGWRPDGVMGLCLNLMRGGYLTYMMTDFNARAIRQANLFVSIAPARPYTDAERAVLREFVEGGGHLILAASYDDRAPLAGLLADFGFRIGDGTEPVGPVAGPKPFGFFKSPFFDTGKYRNHVRFHSAWPVFSAEPDARPLAYGKGNEPAILMRRIGRGKVVVIGDTAFAMNKNLEIESGQPFEGMRENPHFWRWLLTDLRDRPRWVPPDPEAERAAHQAAAAAKGGG